MVLCRYRLQAGASAALVGTYLVALVLAEAGNPQGSIPGVSRVNIAWLGVAINVAFGLWWVYEVAMRKRVRRCCRRLSAKAEAKRREIELKRKAAKERERLRKKALSAAMPASFGVASNTSRFDNAALEMAVASAPNPLNRWEQEWAAQESAGGAPQQPGATSARAQGSSASRQQADMVSRHNPLLVR